MFTTRKHRRVAVRLMVALAALLAAMAVVVVPQRGEARADASGRGGDYVPFSSPRELLDTRKSVKPGPDSTTRFQVLGVGGIPTSNVSAVLVRVVSAAPTSATWLTLYPDGAPEPNVSMLNVVKDESLSNTAIVRVGSNGRMAVHNAGGSVHIIVEAQGFFTSSTGPAWGGLVPLTQKRVIDTRTTNSPIAANGSRTVDLTAGGVPDGATAAFVELTVPGHAVTTASGWMVATPGASPLPGSGIINYENGINSASGAAVPVSSDGRVTFTNKGAKPAHLIVDVMAYFTRTATAGAGFRPVTGRLHGSTIPANGVVDVVVSGTNGMPTRGVAAAALSLQGGGADYAALRAWPTGSAEPGITFTQSHPNAANRSSAIVRPGIDGKVRIKNISDKPSLVYVDLEGWFAERLPTLPVAPDRPVSALQQPVAPPQTASTIEYAYVDNIGIVRIGHQPSADVFGGIQWTAISGNEAFSGPPALYLLRDGRVQVAALHNDGNIWVSNQVKIGEAPFGGWGNLGGSMAAPPAGVRLANGVNVLFAVDVDGKLWAYAHTGAVPFWRNLGDVNLTGTPAVVAVRDGMQVFARSTDGAIATILYRTDGSVSPWTNLGGTGAGAPAVVAYPGHVLRVVIRAADNTIVTKRWDPSAGAPPAAWDPVGTFVSAGDPTAILDPSRGRTAVVARGQDNFLYLSMETAQGSGDFGAWNCATNVCGDPRFAVTADPVAAPVTTSNGQSWFITTRNVNGNPQVLYQPPDQGEGMFAASS